MNTWAVIAIVVVLTSPTSMLAGEGRNAPYAARLFASGATPTQDAQPASSNLAEQSASLAPREGCQPRGFWSKLWSKLASKKQLQCELSLIRDRVNELDELTAASIKTIKDVDARAQAGVQLLSVKAIEADQRAVDARNQAQLAQHTATESATRVASVERAMENIDTYQSTIQTEIHFRPRQVILSQQARTALDEIASPLKEQHGYLVEVQGFSAEGGDTAIQNSRVLADSVTQYLVSKHSIPAYRIHEVSLGNVPSATTNRSLNQEMRGGRVEVNVLRNDIKQSATSAPQQDEMPRFPWPPPVASARKPIPKSLLAAGGASLYLKEIDRKLTGALDENGYFERSYFEAPNGFVLVTRLEQIEADGRSKTLPARWSQDMSASRDGFSIGGYVRALFKAPVGYYRIIAFVVGSASFHEDKGAATSAEAISWLTRGTTSLPGSIGERTYDPDMSCTALIYEFERQEQNKETQFLSPSRLDAYTHLVKSGLWKALGGGNRP